LTWINETTRVEDEHRRAQQYIDQTRKEAS
jgi:hypothetical protein